MMEAGRVPEFVLRRTRPAVVPVEPSVMASPDEAPVRWRQFLILLFVLPMFGQIFHYEKIVPPLWALSKMWPVLTLPLCAFILRDGKAPSGTRQILISMLYFILVPSFMGIVTYQQNFFLGLTSQVKLLPILYMFSFTGLLRLLKPTSSEIAKSFLLWGLSMFLVLVILWAVVPQNWYAVTQKVGDSPMFSVDGRGNRIRIPYYFGTIATFYCYRRFFSDKKVIWLLGALAGFGSVLGIIRGRADVLGIALMLALGAFRFSKSTTRGAMLVVIPLLGLGLVSIPYVASTFDTSSKHGFDVRQRSIEKALEYQGHDFVRWIVGNGSITPLDPNGFIRFFNHFFFLADITWVGITFEYGLIGATLVLLIPLRGIWESRTIRPTRQGAFLGSLQDYLIYSLIISPLYPLTLSPGEFVTILAVFVYERERYGSADPRFRHA